MAVGRSAVGFSVLVTAPATGWRVRWGWLAAWKIGQGHLFR